MGTWNETNTLQGFSARVLVKRLVKTTKCIVRERTRNDKNQYSETIGETFGIDNVLLKIQKWWWSIPGSFGELGNTLQSTLDDLTEAQTEKCKYSVDPVIYLALKLLLLDEVLINRDYFVNCGMCLIPSSTESLAYSVINGLGKFPMKSLCIYGAMYPRITEAIIKNSPSLKHLHIFQINLTSDLMLFIGKNCPKLELIHMMHHSILQAISTDAFCEGFFNGESELSLTRASDSHEQVPVSFPHLKVIDIDTFYNKFVLTILEWILFHFENINSVCLDWKTEILEDDRKYFTEKIILPLIEKGKKFSLRSLFLTADILSSLTTSQIRLILQSMPKLEQIYLKCETKNPDSRTASKGGKNLKYLANESKNIKKLFITVSEADHKTNTLLFPFLKTLGENLVSLTIKVEHQKHHMLMESLKQILLSCPCLADLKLFFMSRFSIRCGEHQTDVFNLPKTNLKVLWFHELSPWHPYEGISHEISTRNWLNLIQELQNSSKNLEILSVTLCDSLSTLLDSLNNSKVSCLHIHALDAFEWDVPHESMIKMIKRFPNLKTLYLEEFESDTFWKINKHFANTALKICWGNLWGWPRT